MVHPISLYQETKNPETKHTQEKAHDPMTLIILYCNIWNMYKVTE